MSVTLEEIALEEIRAVWIKRADEPAPWRNNALIQFANRLLLSDEAMEWRYIVAMSKKLEIVKEELLPLLDSEITSPFQAPYFAVKTDSHLMLARLMLTDMSAWDFRTGKRVIKPR
jgi:hypothetical protein